MVVFTCNNCGETLQKPRVAKHYQFQCRTTPFLTCVDCFKDFRGDEYVAHTKCITEAERYGGKDYVPKANANKGEKKQQEWLNTVNNLLNDAKSLTHSELSFLKALSRFENIPRKKAKFFNFVKNAIGNRTNVAVIESVWGKMEAAQKSTVSSIMETLPKNSIKNHEEDSITENQNNENIEKVALHDTSIDKMITIENGDCKENVKIYSSKAKKGSKRTITTEQNAEVIDELVSNIKIRKCSAESESSSDVYKESPKRPKFNWKKTILTIVAKKGEVSLKKLQKKVISQYMMQCPPSVTYEAASSKFNKRIKKVKDIVLLEDQVKLA